MCWSATTEAVTLNFGMQGYITDVITRVKFCVTGSGVLEFCHAGFCHSPLVWWVAITSVSTTMLYCDNRITGVVGLTVVDIYYTTIYVVLQLP